MARQNLKLPKEELIIFTRQLALIMDSNVSLHEGLELINTKTNHPTLKTILKGMLNDIDLGKSLTESMRVYEDSFPIFIINMVDIGEKSGNLTNTLNQVSDAYEKELETSRKVKSAITYPIILSVLMLGVIMLLVLQVLPMFNDILKSLGGEMPALTRNIIAISLFIGKYLWAFIVATIVLIALSFYYKKTDNGRYFFDKLKFKIPVFKHITSALTAVRFSRNLAVLIRSGISITVGMNMIKPIMNNKYVEEKMDRAIKQLANDKSPDTVIESLELFPWVLVKLFSVAQTTGHMDIMLDKAANIMEKETDVQLDKLTTIIEPVLIIILSVIVGIILISVILPIINIMNSIG